MKTLSTISLLALTAAPALAEDVGYDVDGVEHTGYFAAADDGEAAGLVVLVHDWNGIDDFEREQADMMAAEGYDVFVVDMFGADTPTGTMEQNRAASSELGQDREKMRMLLQAGLDQAEQQSDADGMVVAGYCFGGGVALEMARSDFADRADGFGSFHGSLGLPEGQSYSPDAAPILIMHGGGDESQPLGSVYELMQTLEEAGATYTVEVYSGAPHGFTEPGDRYQERAATESWETFNDFLEDRLDNG
ncbi:dienelactone hydrolase family protein [Palleronia sp. LCG004]|uniref:dienelactone hydrolase family protein n=1 Tax=Palleronia sp. LCG004 TaxID=3079304 RepID=UPI002942F72C|nr:dienelactone hydrolase family protein [Palleronia sp. LCG004]WOI56478.1 dienelactone hydrolase family protein [Palleronia sp. LCG004]